MTPKVNKGHSLTCGICANEIRRDERFFVGKIGGKYFLLCVKCKYKNEYEEQQGFHALNYEEMLNCLPKKAQVIGRIMVEEMKKQISSGHHPLGFKRMAD